MEDLGPVFQVFQVNRFTSLSVEDYCVQDGPLAARLELLHELVDLVVHVGRVREHLHQLAEEEGADVQDGPLAAVLFLLLSGTSLSVEDDRVQDGPLAARLELLHELVDLVVHVGRVREHLHQLAEEEGADGGLFVVVLDVHVDDVGGLALGAAALLEEVHGLVVHALLGRDDQVVPAGVRNLELNQW